MQNIFIQNQTSVMKISLSSIFYIKNHPEKSHHLLLVTAEGMYEKKGTLREMAQHFPDLVRCHRACLVNLDKIQSMDLEERQIYFNCDKIAAVQCSRRRYQEVLDKWLEGDS